MELGAESYDAEVRFSGESAVFMGVWVLPDANALDVIADVRDEMDAIQRELPSGIEAGIGGIDGAGCFIEAGSSSKRPWLARPPCA